MGKKDGAARSVAAPPVTLTGAKFTPQGLTAATAYERIVDKLRDMDLRPRSSGSQQTNARCPSHPDRMPSLTVYSKPGKAKVICWAGCDDASDILPALSMTIADLYDERGSGSYRTHSISLEAEARHAARKLMTPSHRALDNLIAAPDFAERLCKIIARRRPELYLNYLYDFDTTTNKALLTDPGYRHVAHLLGGGSNG